jgi:nucleoside-diphosphate-sugar epimerase
MEILITGGAGFIGSHIVDRLLSEGHSVAVLDLWESKEMKAHSENPNFSFVVGDVLDDDLLDGLVSGKDRVIHMAAILGTSETITTYDVEQVAEVNVVGTVKILKLCKKHGVDRVLIPTTPDVKWLNPYKITKAAIEKFAQLFSENYGVETVCMKLGNIYGSRERWLNGPKEAPYNYQKVVPTILMETLKGNPFNVYGNGDQKSEYIYVGDVAESFYRALTSDKDLGGKVIHVGRNQNQSVNEIIDAVEKVWGRKVERNYVDMRVGEDHVEITLDPTLLKELLDYELQWDLHEGLRETIDYYEKAHLGLS